MKTLNMIMVRDDEPISGAEGFLNMLEVQRKMKSHDYKVTLMQLNRRGNDDTDLNELAERYSFQIDVIECPELTKRTEAYNKMIRESDSPWLMFVDYADTMCDLYSMSMITSLLPTNEYDVIWMEYYSEVVDSENNIYVNVVKEADTETHGKLFNRKFLVDNNLFFDEEHDYAYGRIFMMTVISVSGYERFPKITTQFSPFCHTYKPSREHLSVYDIIKRRYEMDMAIVRHIGEHGKGFNYKTAVMRAMCDAYMYLNTEGNVRGLEAIDKGVYDFYLEHSDIIDNYNRHDFEVLLDEAMNDMFAQIQFAYINYGHEMYFNIDNQSFRMWLTRFKRADHRVASLPEGNGYGNNDKVAVFCGTRNVYDNMETAAKSLMYHTKMDRIYFLIEDNSFPHVLPDNFIVMNVKDQEFFDPHGVNFDNVWTYMCMIRGAFTKLLPNEHKILSLDCDIIVNEDISELWDIDLTDYYYAGVPEPSRTKQLSEPYCNFGVIMMNLDKLREDGIDDQIISSLNHDKWGCPEQDCFNHFCKYGIYPLNQMYNSTRQSHITGDTDVEKIAHYAGVKYYKHFAPFKKYERMDWFNIMKGEKTDE